MKTMSHAIQFWSHDQIRSLTLGTEGNRAVISKGMKNLGDLVSISF